MKIAHLQQKSGSFRGRTKGSLRKGVFSLEESLESLKSLDSLQSLENGRILLYSPQSGGSLESLESLNSQKSLDMDFSEKTPFPRDAFFRTRSFLGDATEQFKSRYV